MSNKYNTLAKNTFFVFIGTIGSKLINVFMLPLYTRWLPPNEFGIVDSISTYSGLLIAFAFLNIGDAIFVFPKNQTQQKQTEYFSSGFVFLGIMTILSAFVFFLMQQGFLYFGIHMVLSDYTWMVFALMVTRYLQVYCQSFTRSLDKMLNFSIAGMVLTFSIALFSILLIPSWGVNGYAYALILAQLVAALYSFIGSKSYKYLSFKRISKSSIKELLTYSVPLTPNSIMWWLVNGLNRPIMEKFLGLFSIGLYAVASRFAAVIDSLMNILSTAWTNSVLDEYGKPDFEHFYNKYIRFTTTILFIGLLLITIFARYIIIIFTTPEYYDAYRFIPILALGLIFSGTAGNIGAVFAATKTSKYFFYSSIWGAIISVIGMILLTPLLGLFGTVCAFTLSFFGIMVSRVIYSWKFVKIHHFKYYILLITLFFLLYFIEVHINGPWKYFVDVLCLGFICYTNKNEISRVLMMLSNSLNKIMHKR